MNNNKMRFIENKYSSKLFTGNGWLITFTDLISLMVAFFVMLYAMSTPNDNSFKYQVEGLDKDKKILASDNHGKKASFYGLHRTFSRRAVSISYMEAVLSSKIEENPVFKNAVLTVADDKLIISLPLSEYMEIKGGIAEIKNGKESLFFEIAEMFGNISNKIDVAVYAGGDEKTHDISLSLAYAAKIRNSLKRLGHKNGIGIFTSVNDRIFDQLKLNDVMKEAYLSRVDIIINSDGLIID